MDSPPCHLLSKPPYCPKTRMRRAARELRGIGANPTLSVMFGDELSTVAFVFVRDAAKSQLGCVMNEDGGAIWNAARQGLLPDAISYAIEALEALS